jgi:hypothetical protein
MKLGRFHDSAVLASKDLRMADFESAVSERSDVCPLFNAVPLGASIRREDGLLAFPFPMVGNAGSQRAAPRRHSPKAPANTIPTIIWGVIIPLLMLAGIAVSAATLGRCSVSTRS